MLEADVSPTQITVEWEVKNFFDLPLNDGYVMKTRPFPFAKGQYFLQLRPNGYKIHNTAGWTSLYLMKIYSPSEDRVAFTVGAKKADGSIFQSRDHKFIFAKGSMGYGGGISLRAELLEHKNEVAPDGNLTLFCSARLNSDGAEEAASQTASPDSLLSELNDYKRQVKELEEKFSAVVKEKEAIQRQTEDAKDAVSSELNDFKKQVKALEEKLSVVANEKEELQRQIKDIKDGCLAEFNDDKKMVKDLEEKLSVVVNEKETIQQKVQNSKGALDILSENFKNLYISGSQADITVKTKEKDFTAHRSVLAARSSVFQAMLEVDMVENNDSVITIKDCDASCLESFLLFLYSADLNVVSASNALGLYYLADKYNVTELKRTCSQCLYHELSTDTVCDVARLAALHCETELLEAATDFFISNMADIVSSPKWPLFFMDNASVANELLVKVANNLKK